MEVSLERGRQAILEDLAVALRGAPEAARRDTGRPVERAHEVRQVAEADREGDVGDRARVVREQARRVAQAGANEILVRSHSQDPGEKPQEVERAEAGGARGALEVDLLGR